MVGPEGFCHRSNRECIEFGFVMLYEEIRVRCSLESRLLYFGVAVFWRVALRPSPSSDGSLRGRKPCISIAGNDDRRAGAFAFGELTNGGHADFQLLRFSADNGAIEIRLMQSVL